MADAFVEEPQIADLGDKVRWASIEPADATENQVDAGIQRLLPG